jgi:hypothetical protein
VHLSLVTHKAIFIITGILPDRLKIAVVQPLNNKGKTSMTDYRPISLLTGFSMIHEKAMYSRLRHHAGDRTVYFLGKG